MTHADIITKFLIGYDKANITSSYPSLTTYEIATVLDKAYLALISQKVTGTNFRKAALETDVKAIEDISPLIIRKKIDYTTTDNISSNEYTFRQPENMLYYISGLISINKDVYNTVLTSHAIADKYKTTSTNKPWIETPVCYIEYFDAYQQDIIHVLVDAYKYDNSNTEDIVKYILSYIKKPNSFVADYTTQDSVFELNDSVAEEVINLAIIMSLENVESTRLDSKLKTAVLES